MNDTRRKKIGILIMKLGDIETEIESIKDEEQEYLDSIPESFESKRETSETAVTALDDAFNNIGGALTELEGIE